MVPFFAYRRIWALEADWLYEAHCVSIQEGACFSEKSHLHANFNKVGFVEQVRIKWISTQLNHTEAKLYEQIVMDYFWIPKGWAEQHWTEKVRAKASKARRTR